MYDWLTITIWLIPVFGILQFLMLIDNLFIFQSTDTIEDGSSEKISILIPARNEENCILQCIESIKTQSYKNIEVLILDDNSTDKTRAIIEDAIRLDDRFKLLEGQITPNQFTGKNYACAQLAEAANGTWLLFLDSDTTLGEGAVQKAVAIAKQESAQLVCLWPRQTTITKSEKLLIPLLSFILLAFLPLRFAERTRWDIFTAANGQFMLFDRSIYESCGGHKALKDEILDDIRLAQMVKRKQGKVIVRDAGPHVQCRMYDSFEAIWLGFRKNIYAAFNGKDFIFLVSISLLVIGHAAPIYALAVCLMIGSATIIVPIFLQLIIGIGMRLILALRLNQPLVSSLFHQLSVSILAALSIDSFIGYNGQGVSWKGRTYKRSK